MHVRFGPYQVRDLQFVTAFDVDAKKVGQDLADAIRVSQNNTIEFYDVPPPAVTVQRAWARKFTESGVPSVGDGIKSQVGATITHRVMAKLFEDRGVELLRTYQLNFGGTWNL
jgi:myo-inositol-1-phosphate synthase